MPRHSVLLPADVWYQTLCFLTRIEIVSYQLIGKFFRYLIKKEFGDDKPPFLPIDSIYVYNLSPYWDFRIQDSLYEYVLTPLSWWEIFLPEMKLHEKTTSGLNSCDQTSGSINQTNSLFSQQKLVLINRDFQDDYNCLVQQKQTYYGQGIVSGRRKSRNKFKCCTIFDWIGNMRHSSRMEIRKADKDYLTFVEPLLAPRYVRVLKFMYVSDSYVVSTDRWTSYVDENDEWLRLFETFPHAWLSPELTLDISFYTMPRYIHLNNHRQTLPQYTGKRMEMRRLRLANFVRQYCNNKNVFEKIQPWVLNCKRLLIGPTLTTSLDEWLMLLPKQCKSSFPHCSPDCPSKLQCACLSTSPIRLIPPIEIYTSEPPVLGLHADDFRKWLYCGRRNSNVTNMVNDKEAIMSLNPEECSYYTILSPYSVDDFFEQLRQDFYTSTKHSHQSEYRIMIHLLAYLKRLEISESCDLHSQTAQFAKTLAWLESEKSCTCESSDDKIIYHSAELDNPRTNERLTVSLSQATEMFKCEVNESRNLIIDRQLIP